MNLIENIRLALKSLWANKLRSFLTLLGMVIGVYAVVTLLSAAQGVQNQINGFVTDLGPDTILVMPGEQAESGSFNFASQFAPSTLMLDDVAELKAKADLIKSDQIDYANFLGGLLSFGDKKVSSFPAGISAGAEDLFGTEIISGRTISEDDLRDKSAVVAVSKSVAEELGVKVNDKVKLGARELTVIGTFDAVNSLSFDPTIKTLVVVPVTWAAEVNGNQQLQRLVVKAKDVNKVEEAKQQVIDVLSAKHGAADFTVQLPSDILETVNQITDVLAYMVVGIASISLLVGGIGISNIMLVTVSERTREIGIRKAIGATEGAILFQFLIESVVLTVLGALIGLTLAWATGYLAAKYTPLEPLLTWQTVGLALAMGAIAGVVFGLFPAFRAARKHPVQALRFE